MTVRVREWEAGPEALPKAPLLRFRVRRGRTPMELAWKVEWWPRDGYMSAEAPSLRVALAMAVMAWLS